jgi:hypothetical protein
VLTLAGILKAILLVATSVLLYNDSITLLQFLGYSIALAGLIYYSLGWTQIKSLAAASSTWLSETLDETRMPPLVRRAVSAVLVLLIVLMLFIGLRTGGGGEQGAAVVQTPDAEGWGFSWMSRLGWGGA